jgi:hypothetical protein
MTEYTVTDIAAVYLGDVDLDALAADNPEAYETLELFAEAGSAEGQETKTVLYYEALDTVESGMEKYDPDSEQYQQLQPLHWKLAATPGMR